ncbi:MAG TPA: DUF1499 domain-containing protein [Isosphaeraceae bacterium]|nr:DUF1499 domain-containing protein [Isosphaeraceae bacterium]
MRRTLLITIVGVATVSFRDALTKNWADIESGATDSALRPILRSETPEHAVSVAVDRISRLPRWKVESADPKNGTIHATRTTRLWRFVDDIHLRFEPTPQGCRITAHSQSRVGKGDLGQNARNLKELARALRRP